MNVVSPDLIPETITPEDPRFEYWNSRSANSRLKGKPAYIIPVDSIEKLTAALQETVNANLRLAIRGGGHCLENFVSDDAVQVIIDISSIKSIRYDPEFNAIEIHAGVTLGEMHEKLYNDYGTVLPSGEHPAIGIGGHIQGGAFGFICRRHGLGADYLYAVEVLWVNENGRVEKAIATREKHDDNRELWWAHTGGGAGNFGVVTRYWFSIPDVTTTDPSLLLPKAPAIVETIEIDWQWSDINEEIFVQLVNNFCTYSKLNAGFGIPADSLFATLHLWNQSTGNIQLKAVLVDEVYFNELTENILATLHTGLDIPFQVQRKRFSWPGFALNPFPDIFTDAIGSFKLKDAFLLEPFTPEQIKVMFQYLTTRPDVPGGFFGLATYGGKINTVGSASTASYQRRAILTTSCVAGWVDNQEESKYLDWVRNCYKDIFIETGGVPVPGKQLGGCIIAHPDNDLLDPELNKSGVPWYTLYYQDNYPRLQKIKNKWDPLDIFKHRLSVQGT